MFAPSFFEHVKFQTLFFCVDQVFNIIFNVWNACDVIFCAWHFTISSFVSVMFVLSSVVSANLQRQIVCQVYVFFCLSRLKRHILCYHGDLCYLGFKWQFYTADCWNMYKLLQFSTDKLARFHDSLKEKIIFSIKRSQLTSLLHLHARHQVISSTLQTNWDRLSFFHW